MVPHYREDASLSEQLTSSIDVAFAVHKVADGHGCIDVQRREMADYAFEPFVFAMNISDDRKSVEARRRFQVDSDVNICRLLRHRSAMITATRSVAKIITIGE